MLCLLVHTLSAEITMTGAGGGQVGDFKLEAYIFSSSSTQASLSITLREKGNIVFSYSTGGRTSFYSNHDLDIHITEKSNELVRVELKKKEDSNFYYKIEKNGGIWDFTEWPDGVERVEEKTFGVDGCPIPWLLDTEPQIQSR